MPGLTDLNLTGLVDDGTPFLEILRQACELSPRGDLSTVGLLHAVQSELVIPFTATRDLLEYFSPDWSPLVDGAIIEERWQTILRQYGH